MRALRFYVVVSVTGAVIMALEILSSRILAPEFGNSVFVWGSIISVFLAALSVGYYLGGRLADRNPSMAALARLISMAALFQAGLIVVGGQITSAIGSLTHGSPAGTLLATTVLFGPPSILLATVSPFVVRLAARDLSEIGNTAGRLYAVSTAGSLVGTLICTFVLIPRLEVHQILSLLLLATALVAILGLVDTPGRQRIYALATGLLAIFAVWSMTSTRELPSGVVHFEVSPYQTLRVSELSGQRFLYGDRTLYSAVSLEDRQTSLPYQRYAAGALLLNPDIRSLLSIGMGSGGIGTYLRTARPDLEIDYVEIDPAVARIARRFFFFEDDPRTRVHIEDARQFLRRSERSWDYIYTDAYIGMSIPFHLTTVEFLDEVKRHLNPGGVFGLNLAAGLLEPFPQAILRTLAARFETVFAFAVRGSSNLYILAADTRITLPRIEMIQRGQELDPSFHLEPSLAHIAASRLEIALDPEVAVLLTDRFAPANHLVAIGSKTLDLPTASD